MQPCLEAPGLSVPAATLRAAATPAATAWRLRPSRSASLSWRSSAGLGPCPPIVGDAILQRAPFLRLASRADSDSDDRDSLSAGASSAGLEAGPAAVTAAVTVSAPQAAAQAAKRPLRAGPIRRQLL